MATDTTSVYVGYESQPMASETILESFWTPTSTLITTSSATSSTSTSSADAATTSSSADSQLATTTSDTTCSTESELATAIPDTSSSTASETATTTSNTPSPYDTTSTSYTTATVNTFKTLQSSTPSTIAPQATGSQLLQFQQVARSGADEVYPWGYLAAANFDDLCPSGNCLVDCSNLPRLFQSIPDGMNYTVENYDSSVITLFGLCSNLEPIITAIYQTSDLNSTGHDLAPYFPLKDDLHSNVTRISASISNCLTSSCDQSRESQDCLGACSTESLFSGSGGLNEDGLRSCLVNVCGNTCGLPYADQDVLGVGVLVSYVMQALIILSVALFLACASAWYSVRKHRRHPDHEAAEDEKATGPKVLTGLEKFLAASCYFGIFLQIAALCQDVNDIDPLNGYALLSVSITGFVPPNFILMLLQSQGSRSWYLHSLTALSWILSSVVFFMLLSHLPRGPSKSVVTDQSLRALFHISECGGSSAMALCYQTVGGDPLTYLAAFYNQEQYPNLTTIPILWIWSTMCFFVLLLGQTVSSWNAKSHKQKSHSWIVEHTIVGIQHWSTCLIASILFGLCLGYQARMVVNYNKMDMIDWDGWTFGQIIAVTIWIPPIFEYVHDLMSDKDEGDEDEASNGLPSPSNPGMAGPGYHPVPSTPGQKHDEPSIPAPLPLAHSPGLPKGKPVPSVASTVSADSSQQGRYSYAAISPGGAASTGTTRTSAYELRNLTGNGHQHEDENDDEHGFGGLRSRPTLRLEEGRAISP